MRVRTGLGPGQHEMTPKKSVLDILDDSDPKDEENLSNGSHNLSNNSERLENGLSILENGHSSEYVVIH